ncbi:MAG TPA: MarR family winged helix-turn-helix transcriptional regulator [Bryobacteraceae bacterium]|nr:MarR family winged helix-turn-helix transcriptional regulator [Bryobacteraceae bacterium]
MDPVRQVMTLYPRIFFACHTRHVRDPKTSRTVSAHQASILDHLDEIEHTGLNQLARHMGVTASTMSLTVDRLARAGYVVRAADPKDGRRVALRITRAGARLRDQMTVLDPERVRGMLACLKPGERREAIRGLELLARAADESIAARTERTLV